MPEFPADLMDPGPGLEPEPILLIKVGMLVQVQDKARRADGGAVWADGARGGRGERAAASGSGAPESAGDVPKRSSATSTATRGQQLYTVSSTAAIVRRV